MGEVVVSADWVADRRRSVRIVDVRDAWEFDGIGHVPGAVNVPFDAFRSEFEGEAGHLPGADVFADLMREAGITKEDRLVAYDDTHGVFAARFLVTAELYGHDPGLLHLLDGDFSAWQREYETTTETETEATTETETEATTEAETTTEAGTVETTTETGSSGPTSYEAVFDESGPLVGMDAVREAVDDPETVVVDTREPWEYEEGHIPGAVQIDWRELVDDESRGLKPEAELREILGSRGITPDRHVLLYCNTARRISHTYTVLRHLDYPDLAFYEGSLTEWEREGGAIER